MRSVRILAATGAALAGCSQLSEPTSPGLNTSVLPDAVVEQECDPSGGYGFVCGVQNAEDLVLVPETEWIIASSMAPGGAIYLIDAERKSATDLYPAEGARVEYDVANYPFCPGQPDLDNFITHGLNLRVGPEDRQTLYAVSHGAREAIEVFDVNMADGTPDLTWIGCVLMPEGLAANSVASFSDGALVATVLLYPDRTFDDMISGEPTGAVYQWSSGDEGFTLIEGTELPGNNGSEEQSKSPRPDQIIQ